MTTRLLRAALVIVAVGSMHLASPSFALEGKVVDGSTGKPLAGVYVIGAWHVSTSLGVVPKSGCAKLEVTRTDEQGQFNLSKWSGNILAHLFGDENLNVYYYLRGYRWEKGFEAIGEVVMLVPDVRTSLERLGYMSELVADIECGSLQQQVKLALPLYHLIYDEGAELASNPRERRVLNTILFRIEVLELGYDKATDNVLNRPLRDYE